LWPGAGVPARTAARHTVHGHWPWPFMPKIKLCRVDINFTIFSTIWMYADRHKILSLIATSVRRRKYEHHRLSEQKSHFPTTKQRSLRAVS
jgi:hypothetical protein